LVDPTKPKGFYGKTLPDAAYLEQINVYECAAHTMATAEDFVFNSSGELLYHYKWADPKYLNLSTIGFSVGSGSVGYTGLNLACEESPSVPLVSKKQLAEMEFTSLFSAPDDGEIFFGSARKTTDQIEITTLVKYPTDHNVKQFFVAGTDIPDPPNYRIEADQVIIRCEANKFGISRTEFWNASNELVRLSIADPSVGVKFTEIGKGSPFELLQTIFCHKPFVGVGVRFKKNHDAFVVSEVIKNSPAEKAGVLSSDTITAVDGVPVNELTQEQLVERIRGEPSTSVTLKLLRQGQDRPLEFSIQRELIQSLERSDLK
jgi:hypothetical protein